MNIVKQYINAENLNIVSSNETINASITKKYGPEFLLEDESSLIFTSEEQCYPGIFPYIDYFPDSIYIDRFAREYQILSDDVPDGFIYRNKEVKIITEYKFNGLPVYRLFY